MPNEHPLRVVVADDDADVLFLMRRALEASGRFDVVGEAADGDDAVDVARVQQPDVVLLDLDMPRVDGLTALPRVRAVCPPDTVVVVVSGHRTSEAGQRAVREGAAAFLAKDPGFSRLVEDLLALADRAPGDALPDERAVHWHLPADLTSGARARRHLRVLLDDWHVDGLLEDAELLATELVNNAVVHGRSDVFFSVKLRHGALRVEVTDVGRGVPHRPETDLDDTHGRGLLLVDAISADWGTAVDGDSKTVWFELPTGA